MRFNYEAITPEFLQENDGRLVWIRWDYLSMRGISEDTELVAFLDHVEKVKKKAQRAGAKFSA